MKNGNLATKLMLAAIFLAVAAYFGISAAAYFMDFYTTTPAYTYTSESAAAVSGYVVRNEEVLPGGGELVYTPWDEGERVSAGSTVALIYQSPQSLNSANALRDLEEQLLYAQTLAPGAQAAARLDDEVTSALLQFRRTLASQDSAAMEEDAGAVRSCVLKRSYAYSGAGGLEDTIAGLQDRISALGGSGEQAAARVTAPKAGLFSSMVDGYEGVLNLEMLQTLTPSGYRAIAPAEDAGGLGKMVYGNKWSFVTLMRSEDIVRRQPGSTVTLRFQTGLSRDVEMTVESISAEEDGRRVVVFSSERYLHLTTLLRRQNAQVIFQSYTGIRVPRSAVRVEQTPVLDEEGNPVLDSAGEQKTQAVTCVYCVWGEYARRKPVQVLWQEESFILVLPDSEALDGYATESARAGRRLRAGDQVITSAAEIYDGKVVMVRS